MSKEVITKDRYSQLIGMMLYLSDAKPKDYKYMYSEYHEGMLSISSVKYKGKILEQVVAQVASLNEEGRPYDYYLLKD